MITRACTLQCDSSSTLDGSETDNLSRQNGLKTRPKNHRKTTRNINDAKTERGQKDDNVNQRFKSSQRLADITIQGKRRLNFPDPAVVETVAEEPVEQEESSVDKFTTRINT